MRLPFKSIRARLTLWYSLVVLATLVAFGIITYIYFNRKLLDNLDLSLRNEVKWINEYISPKAGKLRPSSKYGTRQQRENDLTSLLTPDHRTGDDGDAFWSQIYAHALVNQRRTLIEVTDKRGVPIYSSTNTPEDNLVIGEVPLNTIKIITLKGDNGKDLRVAATTTESLNIYVAYPLDDLRGLLDNLYAIFLVLVPITLAASIAGGWFLANKSLRPVDLITKTARRITAERLDQKIPEHETDDELGRLILTLNGMIERLRQSFERIKQFTVDASHELRTPLTIMRGEVEIALSSSQEPEEYRRVLVSNLEENLRLASIIDGLLTLSKADMGQDVLSLQEIHLRTLFEELTEDADIIAMKKEIKIDLNVHDDLVIQGDLIRLRQLFLNLIDNAVKYTPERGSVSIVVLRAENYALIRVSDTGVGIPLEEQARIFDRFYRVDKARSSEHGGSGLGLSISKTIAELHNGSIAVSSKPGEGSTFIVRLPLFWSKAPPKV